MPNPTHSKKIQSLRESIASASSPEAKLRIQEEFWKSINSTPLIEPIPNDNAHGVVTFLWYADQEIKPNQKIYLILYIGIDLRLEGQRLENIPETNIYSLSLILPIDLRATYAFYIQPDGIDIEKLIPADKILTQQEKEDHAKKLIELGFYQQLIRDDLNPNRFEFDPSQPSLLIMPNAPINPFPQTLLKANQQREQVKMEGRFQILQYDFAKSSLSQTAAYESVHKDCDIEIMFCKNAQEYWQQIESWQAANKNSRKLLFIKNMETGEMSIGSSQNFKLIEGDFEKKLKSITPENFILSNELKQQLISYLDGRPYWVYLPPNYAAEKALAYPLLLFLDGGAYLDLIPTVSILEDMIKENKIPPVIAVFLEPPTAGFEARSTEYACNPLFTKWLATEFIPLLQQQYTISKTAKNLSIVGSSMSALAAIYTGFMYPNVFGNVISQSASLQDESANSLEPLIRAGSKTHFHLEAGYFEQEIKLKSDMFVPFNQQVSLLSQNQKYQIQMRENKINVTYREYTRGHCYSGWSVSLPIQLLEIFNSSPQLTQTQQTTQSSYASILKLCPTGESTKMETQTQLPTPQISPQETKENKKDCDNSKHEQNSQETEIQQTIFSN